MSTRNVLLNGLVTALQKIKKSNGYNTDPGHVVRGFMPFEKIVKFPALMVFGGNEALEPLLDGTYTRSAFTIKIRGITLDKKTPDEALCDIIADVLKLLESTDNPYQSEMIVHTIDTDEGWYQLEREGTGFFEVGLDIFYIFDRSAP